MDWAKLLYELIEVCILPALAILTTYLVKYFKIKSEEISNNIDNDLGRKYVEMLSSTISECVIATNQTYVNSLKAQGNFDIKAQKAAFDATYNAVLAILSDEAKVYLESAYGDLTTYITKKIEAEVNLNK